MEKKFDISKITDYLYISEYPKEKDIRVIHDLNINMIISMTWYGTPKAIESFNHTHVKVRALDSPITPISMKGLFRGVTEALKTINSGGKVLVHCKHGVHRSVAMGACILIAKGYNSTDAMDLIKDNRSVARPETFYIKKRIVKFEEEWNKK